MCVHLHQHNGGRERLLQALDVCTPASAHRGTGQSTGTRDVYTCITTGMSTGTRGVYTCINTVGDGVEYRH